MYSMLEVIIYWQLMVVLLSYVGFEATARISASGYGNPHDFQSDFGLCLVLYLVVPKLKDVTLIFFMLERLTEGLT